MEFFDLKDTSTFINMVWPKFVPATSLTAIAFLFLHWISCSSESGSCTHTSPCLTPKGMPFPSFSACKSSVCSVRFSSLLHLCEVFLNRLSSPSGVLHYYLKQTLYFKRYFCLSIFQIYLFTVRDFTEAWWPLILAGDVLSLFMLM